MAGDIGSESANGSAPKPEASQTAGNSESEKKAGHSLTFRKAIGRARESLQKRLGLSRDPFAKELRRKVAGAAPEGYRWLTNLPKDLTGFEEDKKGQEQYIEDLRRNNDVHFGEAFDIKGNPLPDSQAVYIKPNTSPQK